MNDTLPRPKPKIEAPRLELPMPKPRMEIAPPVVESASQSPYSENDLHQQFAPQLREYFSVMTGSLQEDWTDEELAAKFANRMRGFSSGNSVDTIREFSRLKQLSDEDLQKVGEAYHIWHNMESLWSSETSVRERVGGVVDYARSMILDPANILSLGVGKLALSGSTKIAAKEAQKLAAKEYAKHIAAKATKEAATEAAEKVFVKSTAESIAKEGVELAARQGARDATTTAAQKLTTGAAYKELGATMGTDLALSIGTELAYQKGMIMTDVQEDYEPLSFGLAALGVMAVGGLSAASITMKGRSGNRLLNFSEDPDATKNAFESLSKEMSTEGFEKFSEKVARGKELSDLDNEFWRVLVLGDKDMGFKGLAHSLQEHGFVFNPRYKDEPLSNQLAEVFTKGPKEAVDGFIDEFVKKTGIKMDEAKKLTGQEFQDAFAAKISGAAKTMNAISQAAKRLGKADSEVSVEEALAESLGLLVGPNQKQSSLGQKIADLTKDISPEAQKKILRFQNNTIRMIVSSLATTNLNVKGWGFASMMNSLSDTLLAGWKGMRGDTEGAKQLLSLQKQKFYNLLDPYATYDSYLSMIQKLPREMSELTYVIPGGVEDMNKIARSMGFDPSRNILDDIPENFADVIQKYTLVIAQDNFTKSQEFIYQLDRELRLRLGKTFKEFTANPVEANKMVKTEAFKEAITKANDATLKAIFSKSYKGKGFLGEAAGAIEDARNIPGIGLLVPFGRFFNNTLATASDYSGLSAAMKMVGQEGGDSLDQSVMKAAVSWGLILTMMEDEVKNIEEGLGIFESYGVLGHEADTTGSTRDYTWEFPYSLFKGVARIGASYATESGLSSQDIEELNEIASRWEILKAIGTGAVSDDVQVPGKIPGEVLRAVFGQLTRELVQTGDNLYDIIVGTIGNDPAQEGRWKDAIVSIGPKFASGWTRFLEPVDQAVGLATSVDFSAMDRKQGNRLINDSMRYTSFMREFFTQNISPRQYSAAQGKVPVPDGGKFFGSRSPGQLTYTEKVLNNMGIPAWTIDKFSRELPKFANEFDKAFNSILEAEMEELWGTSKFQEYPYQKREILFDKAIGRARSRVMSIMESRIQETGDRAQIAMYRLISGNDVSSVKRAAKKIRPEKELDEMTLSEIHMIEAYLKNFKQEVLAP